MAESPTSSSPGRSIALALLAWCVPGAGHLALRRGGRAAIFAAVVAVALATGVRLEGNLYRPLAGQPLTLLATLGAMGAGGPYFLLRGPLGYEGDPTGPGYEYGTAFLLSAGLMNLLLILDVLDIARGRKP